jgi:hypothetical protein
MKEMAPTWVQSPRGPVFQQNSEPKGYIKPKDKMDPPLKGAVCLGLDTNLGARGMPLGFTPAVGLKLTHMRFNGMPLGCPPSCHPHHGQLHH